MRRRRSFNWAAAVALLALVGGIFVATPERAEAYNIADFDAGYIMSDSIFFNSGSMGEAQIQSFLQSQVPNCNGGGGAACLPGYSATTWAVPASATGNCAAYGGGAIESASRILFKVAQACGINPQVLLVLLQKEQGLITATAPTELKYRKAMGYGCPDTAACDAQFYGFFNQVYKAAWQFKQYTLFPNRTFKIGNISIPYQANRPDCGSSVVNIRNQATANLYNYTPYQPNGPALANPGGLGDGCSAYGNRNFWIYFSNWFGSPTGRINPIASLDAVTASPGNISLAGWAFDPDTKSSLGVHVYVNDVGTAFTASDARPDLVAAYGDIGANHGFNLNVAVGSGGAKRVCVYAINQGPGTNVLMGGTCRTVTMPTGGPVGLIDAITATAGTISFGGWAFDPDVTASIPVHVYVDSAGTAFTADQSRPDVAGAYPGYGNAHGFSAVIAAAPGQHRVCIYGINSGPGSNSELGCRTVTVPGGSPVGVVDAVTTAVGSITTTGWTFDPDIVASIGVHIYVDSAGVAYVADNPRPDVAAIFAGYGEAHGYSETVAAAPGAHRVCAYGINAGSGSNTELGCRNVTVPSGNPIGVVDAITASPKTISTAGWVFDPDSSAAIAVHVYVDSVGVAFSADRPRPDVAAAYPGHGDLHGYVTSMPATPGEHKVCVYGINSGPGANVGLGCRVVIVPGG